MTLNVRGLNNQIKSHVRLGKKYIGFNHMVSIGDMLDVTVKDIFCRKQT